MCISALSSIHNTCRHDAKGYYRGNSGVIGGNPHETAKNPASTLIDGINTYWKNDTWMNWKRH
jgi:hypothetical protein